MVDFLEVAQSWYRVAKHTPEQKALAEERSAVCNVCPFKVHDDTRLFFKCSACGCPLAAKVYSPKGGVACPKGRWER